MKEKIKEGWVAEKDYKINVFGRGNIIPAGSIFIREEYIGDDEYEYWFFVPISHYLKTMNQ